MTIATAKCASATGVDIACNTQVNRAEWDEYVRAHPQGSFFQLSGWGEVARHAYGYEPLYITARRGGVLGGVMLLTDVRTPLLGRSLVSTAFTVGGGPLADDPETLQVLLSTGDAAGREREVRYVESRLDADADGWRAKPVTHANFSLDLLADEKDALDAVPRKRRADIRKAISMAETGALSIRHDGEPELFYNLYAKSLRRLGTPVFPKKFLAALLEYFGRVTEVSVVSYEGAPICALLTFYHGHRALPYYVGAEDSARAVHAFDFLYWSVMRRAAAHGCKTLDFGRSKIDSGAYKYKKLWGIEPEPLTYRIKLMGDSTLPDVSASNPKFALFSRIWPRLPLAVTNRLGPLLAPNFP